MSGQIEELAIDFNERWQGGNHEAVIRRSSKFFDNAMKEESAASRLEARTVSIVDKDLTIFKIYLHWLHFKTFPIVTTKSTGGFNHETGMLSKSYVMGEMLMDTTFKNPVLIASRDALLDRPFYKRLRPGFSIVKTIYDGTPEGSPGRRFMVDVWVREANENWAIHLDDMPLAFTKDLSKAFMTCARTRTPKMTLWTTSMKDFMET
ncbi:hypothetical protein J4E91_001028 [Alternaria rosae]|nr:hypothetical protein J4E91_001028 [Alternaria rosae]